MDKIIQFDGTFEDQTITEVKETELDLPK